VILGAPIIPSYVRLLPPPPLLFEIVHARRTRTGNLIGIVPKAR
jgi:hypothetical protein